MAKLRLFIAAELSAAQRAAAEKLLRGLGTASGFTKAAPNWVRPENLHLTLKFLGDTEEGRLPVIQRVMDDVGRNQKPFDFDFRDLGVFPDERRPRVVWVGVTKGAAKLGRLHDALDAQLQQHQFRRDTRAFHPHLTLARLKNLRGAGDLIRMLGQQRNLALLGQARLEKITLFTSELLAEGARYTVLYSANLEGGSAAAEGEGPAPE